MSLARRVAEARLAVMLLTCLPMGRIADPVPNLAAACWAFPLVGVLVGVIGWAVQQGALALGLGPLVASLMALGALALATGALHLDGLADFFDAIGGGRDRAHCLEIMRDSRIGTYGVVALIFAVALPAGALSATPDGLSLAAFLLTATASRLAMLAVLDLLPPARADGLGHSASGRVPLAWMPGALLVIVIGVHVGFEAAVALLAMGLAGGLIAVMALRRLGGQTGDVLGATQLCAEAAGFIALSGWAAI